MVDKIKPTVDKTKDALAEAASTLAGFVTASFAMALYEKFLPAGAQKFSPVIGAAGFVPHYVPGAGDNWKAFGNGVVACGAVEVLKKVTSGGDPNGIMSKVNAALPGRGTFNLGNLPLRGPLRGVGATKADERLLHGPAPVRTTRLLTDEMLAM